jgi:hypothetical protein
LGLCGSNYHEVVVHLNLTSRTKEVLRMWEHGNLFRQFEEVNPKFVHISGSYLRVQVARRNITEMS